jgi:hypothetical protein
MITVLRTQRRVTVKRSEGIVASEESAGGMQTMEVHIRSSSFILEKAASQERSRLFASRPEHTTILTAKTQAIATETATHIEERYLWYDTYILERTSTKCSRDVVHGCRADWRV